MFHATLRVDGGGGEAYVGSLGCAGEQKRAVTRVQTVEVDLV